MLSDAVKLLVKHDRLGYVDMWEPLEKGDAEVLHSSDAGVLARFENGSVFSALFDSSAAEYLASLIPDDCDKVEIHEKAMERYILDLGFESLTPCSLYVYDKTEPVSLAGYETFIMDTSYLDTVVKHYHLFTDIPYFLDRLERGYFMGILKAGHLAGFISRHPEGAMGMLEIFPEARRCGLAYELEGAYINAMLHEGRIPYCNVVNGNLASERLQTRLGLVKVSDSTDWFGR